MNNWVATIRRIRIEQQRLVKRLNSAAEKAYPVGSTIKFYRGVWHVRAEIYRMEKTTRVGVDPSFWIKSHTNKEYSAYLYEIMRQKAVNKSSKNNYAACWDWRDNAPNKDLAKL